MAFGGREIVHPGGHFAGDAGHACGPGGAIFGILRGDGRVRLGWLGRLRGGGLLGGTGRRRGGLGCRAGGGFGFGLGEALFGFGDGGEGGGFALGLFLGVVSRGQWGSRLRLGGGQGPAAGFGGAIEADGAVVEAEDDGVRNIFRHRTVEGVEGGEAEGDDLGDGEEVGEGLGAVSVEGLDRGSAGKGDVATCGLEEERG